MTSTDRRAREKAETQEKILAAARELFVRLGYDAVTVRRIAQAIEYTPAALYVHFKDKEEIIRTLCRRDFDAFSEKFAEFGSLADPIERIRRAGLAYIRFAVENPNQFRLMFMTPIPVEKDEEDLAKKDDPHRNGYAFIRQAAAQAIAEKRLLPGLDDAELVAQTLWAGVHGVAALEVAMRGDDWVPWRRIADRAALMVDALTRGILAAPQAPSAPETSR